MVTLQENVAKFNNNLIVSHNGGQLSSDSGLVLVDELMDAFQFTQLSEKVVKFKDNRKYWTHEPQGSKAINSSDYSGLSYGFFCKYFAS